MISLFPPEAPRHEPGVYDTMPAWEYHRAVGISNSMLKPFGRSPAHLLAYMHTPRETTAAMRLGTFVHTAVLEPDVLPEWIVRPEGMDGRTREGKAWAESVAVDGLTIVSQEEAAAIIGIRDSVMAHPFARKVLSGEHECSIFTKDEETGLMLKCRPDALPLGNIVGDLKTTEDASEEAFARTIATFRYHVQAAYYLDQCNQHGLGREAFFFVAVEKKAPYAVNVFQLDAETLEIGRRTYRKELRKLAECIEKDEWPAYETPDNRGYNIIELPAWSQRQALIQLAE